MITKFTKITNALASLGDEINNDQKVRKVICALPPSWEGKEEKKSYATTIGNLDTSWPNVQISRTRYLPP